MNRTPYFAPLALVLLVFLALLLGILLVVPASGAEGPKGSPEQRQTITDIRSVGTAMFHWYKDQLAPRRSPEAHESAEQAAENQS